MEFHSPGVKYHSQIDDYHIFDAMPYERQAAIEPPEDPRDAPWRRFKTIRRQS
jgi:hypothetical protein